MRIVNRVLGLLLGLLLLGAGVVAAVETVLDFLGRPAWLVSVDQWAPTLSELTWDDRTLIVVAALTLAAGVALVGLQLWPARVRTFPMVEPKQDRLVALDSRGLQELLRRSAVDDGDVLDATVRVSRRRVRVSGLVPHDRDTPVRRVQTRTRERLQSRIDDLRLHHSVKVRVHMKRSKVRVR